MTTLRPISPGAESLLFKEIPILNLGYVQPIDYMGTDIDIVQAARVSYGPSTRKLHDDRGLLRYLMRHYHSTPFEMCEVKFRCKMPIFVARQWIRHRTACLTGDTKLHFDLPGGIERRGNQLFPLTVEEVWNRFQPTYNRTRPDRQRNPYFRRDRVQKMLLRSIDESTHQVRHTRIVDIWETGKKHVYEVVTKSGHKAMMSEDHRCLTSTGWKTLKEIVDLESLKDGLSGVHGNSIPGMMVIGPGRNSGIVPFFNEIDPTTEIWAPVKGWEDYYEVSDQGRVRRILGGQGVRDVGSPKKVTISNAHAVVSLSRNGKTEVFHIHHLMMCAFTEGKPFPEAQIRHLDGNGLNNTLENLAWGTAQENADDRVHHGATASLAAFFDEIQSVTYAGVRPTYDLEVEGPWHNFSAGGLVVHNSVNEMSLRYTEAPDEFYTPALENISIQSTSNKQGREEVALSPEKASEVQELLRDANLSAYEIYERLVSHYGIARELSRTVLPVSLYTQWIWKIDLKNLLGFLRLRMDSHAQVEIRHYADAMASFVEAWVPLTWEAFQDYQQLSMTLSRLEIEALGKIMTGTPLEEITTLKGRELAEFKEKILRIQQE